MSHFAKVVNGVVTNVLVADQDFIDNMLDTSPGRWIETFKDGSQRKNYAGIGFSYDLDRDAFIPPKPYDSWMLNETTCLWEAPTAYPTDGQQYVWNESTTSWDLIAE